MKKNSFIVLAWCFFSSFAQAQMYVRAFTGYAFSSNPTTEQSQEIVNNVENVYVSKFRMGQGVNLGLALGYQFNKSLSFEIKGNTQILASYTISIPQKDLRTLNNFSFIGYFGDVNYSNVIFQFAPQLVYSVDYNKKLRFFIQSGPGFMSAKTKFRYNYTGWQIDTSGWEPNQIAENITLKGKLNIGIQSSAGIDYRLSENLRLLCEFIFINGNYQFKKEEITRYDVDGTDHLSDLSTRTYSLTDGSKTDFSHWGINIGIKYSLQKAKRAIF
jgi:hypothetical protein